MKLLVTAGGKGTKLWPFSKDNKPKQFQAIVGDKPIYQYTIDLLLQHFDAKDIYISTKRKYYNLAKKQSPRIPKENYILEPDIPKDRGPGEGFAFLNLSMKCPEDPFFLVQADCLRFPEEKFIDMIHVAEKIQIRDKKYTTGGMKATYPTLGIDYIKLGKKLSCEDGIDIFKADEFIKRNNDYYKTKELIENFYVSTHSNHACWYPDLMMDAYKTYRPDWHDSLMKIRDILVKNGNDDEIDEVFNEMEAGSTEDVTKNTIPGGYIILLPFKWTDVGTWDSVYEYFDKKGAVYSDGNILDMESKSSLVKCDNPKKIVAVYGIDNLVIVDTKDALLVVPRDKSDKVGELLKQMKERGLTSYL